MTPAERAERARVERAKRLASPRTTEFLTRYRAPERAADQRTKATSQSATR